MADEELEAIRARRMAELQQQYGVKNMLLYLLVMMFKGKFKRIFFSGFVARKCVAKSGTTRGHEKVSVSNTVTNFVLV